MKVQGNRYINNPEMIKNKVEKKTTVPQNIISEDDVKISDSARKLVETARNKVSDFHTMHFSSINGEIREIPAEYKCENLFKLDLKATSISGEQSAFEGCSENQSEVFEKWLDENASEYLTEDEMKDLKEKINAMTADVDSLNAQEGYRGTSYESVFLLSASEAGLRKVNEMYVPEQFQAGFSDMIEVAFAADLLTIKESVEFNKHVKSPKDLMITSCCCPMWVGMLKKVYKELMPDLSPSVSPMIAAGRIIKALNPEAKVVFIGPCIAKKAEAKEKDVAGAIDFVLTFQELNDIFNALSINPKDLKGIPSVEYTSTCGRSYARVGGVTKAIKDTVKELYPNKIQNFRAYRANGIKECKEILNDALTGNINFSFLEGMGCVGGCVGGPKILVSPEEGKEAVDKFAHDSSIKVPVFSPLLQDILVKLNITSLEDFINDDKIKILQRDF